MFGIQSTKLRMLNMYMRPSLYSDVWQT